MEKELQCRKIYEQAFGTDDIDFENLIFEKCFKYVKTVETDGEICSMLFALPCVINTQRGSFDSVYIYAAATREDLRGRGYMASLISKITEKNDKIIFLRPANGGLVAFYEKLGFCTVKAHKSENTLPNAKPVKEFAELTAGLGITADKSEYTAMYHRASPYKLESLDFIYSME